MYTTSIVSPQFGIIILGTSSFLFRSEPHSQPWYMWREMWHHMHKGLLWYYTIWLWQTSHKVKALKSQNPFLMEVSSVVHFFYLVSLTLRCTLIKYINFFNSDMPNNTKLGKKKKKELFISLLMCMRVVSTSLPLRGITIYSSRRTLSFLKMYFFGIHMKLFWELIEHSNKS